MHAPTHALLYASPRRILGLALLFVALSGVASAQLSGTYTIGPDPADDFGSFTEAVAALVAQGVSGPVVFEADPGTYDEQLVIPPISGSSATNTITFTSATGNAADVTLQAQATSLANYVVFLDEADHIHFEALTLRAFVSQATYGRVISMDGTLEGIAVRACTLIGAQNPFNSRRELALIFAPVLTVTRDVGVTDNTFSGGGWAVYLDGATGDRSLGTTFTGNVHTAGASGVFLQFHSGPVLTDNSVTVSTTGFDLQWARGLTVSRNDIESTSTSGIGINLDVVSEDVEITRNVVNVLGYGSGIRFNGVNPPEDAPGLVANNMVTAAGSNNGFGLDVNDSSFLRFYHNSVLVTSTGSGSVAFSGFTLFGGIEVINNLLVATGAAGALAYLIGDGDGDAVTASDYNDYYTTGPTLASWDGSQAATVAQLQALNDMDEHSVSVPVEFVSDTDLHLTGTSDGDSDLIGTPLTAVPIDIDGEPRSPTQPYMGADEAGPFGGGVVTVSAAPVSPPVALPPGGGTFQFRVTLTNTSAQSQTFQAWTAATGPTSHEPVLGPKNVTLPPGGSVMQTLTQQVPGNAPAGTYTYTVNAGTFPGTVLASDSFTLTKEGGEVVARGGGAAADWHVSGWDEVPAAAASAVLPEGSALSAVYPNPSSGRVTLTLEVAAAQHVTAEVYDALGRRVAVLLDGEAEAGTYSLVLDASGLPAGVYVVRVTGEAFTATRRAVYAR